MDEYICNVQPKDDKTLSEIAGCKTLLACSDGGAAKGAGSFGWILKEKGSETFLLKGIGGVDGRQPSSYRCECAGILSVMCIWDCLQSDGVVGPDHKITLYCDNEGVVTLTKKILKWPNFPLPRDAPEADLLYCIKYMADRCRSAFEILWVESHQDEKRKVQLKDLAEEARLNVEADRLASHALQQAVARPIITLKGPAGCDIVIKDASIRSRRNKSIKGNIDRSAMKRTIIKR